MIELGRVIVKIAGRDAGQKGVIVEVLDDTFVMIDGQVRRRKCNIMHIEPLQDTVKLKKGASHAEVVAALKNLGIEVVERKPKTQKADRPRRLRTVKEKSTEAPKEKKAKTEKKPVEKTAKAKKA